MCKYHHGELQIQCLISRLTVSGSLEEDALRGQEAGHLRSVITSQQLCCFTN